MTRAVTVTAAAGALIISVGAARSNPGRFTHPPGTAVVASGQASRPHRRIRRPVKDGATKHVAPSATPAPPSVTVTPAPPVTVSGGS